MAVAVHGKPVPVSAGGIKADHCLYWVTRCSSRYDVQAPTVHFLSSFFFSLTALVTRPNSINDLTFRGTGCRGKIAGKWGDRRWDGSLVVRWIRISAGAAAHAGARWGVLLGHQQHVRLVLWQRRMQLSLSFLWGKNHNLNPVLQPLPGKATSTTTREKRLIPLKGQENPVLAGHGSTKRCCWLSRAVPWHVPFVWLHIPAFSRALLA